MAKKKSSAKLWMIFTVVLLFIAGIAFVLRDNNFGILSPAGQIASSQKNLLIFATALMLLVIIPVYVMAFWFAYKYREGNKKASYKPNWDTNKWVEITWWAIPFVIIFVLAIVTYKSSHDLDPFKPLDSAKKPLNIQVIAMQYKWLFIYPDHNLAVVNFAQIPKDTPVNFTITSDAPMNSFWVPQLAGQIYAMPGMSTQLHLNAEQIGNFRGVSANLSGEGFAGMDFAIRSSSEVDYLQWLAKAKLNKTLLDEHEYAKLTTVSTNNPVAYYSLNGTDLYDKIVLKYMVPADGRGEQQNHMEGHE